MMFFSDDKSFIKNIEYKLHFAKKISSVIFLVDIIAMIIMSFFYKITDIQVYDNNLLLFILLSIGILSIYYFVVCHIKELSRLHRYNRMIMNIDDNITIIVLGDLLHQYLCTEINTVEFTDKSIIIKGLITHNILDAPDDDTLTELKINRVFTDKAEAELRKFVYKEGLQ